MKDYRLKENQRYECDSCHKIFSGLICKPEWDTGFLCKKCFEKVKKERKI